MRSGLSQVSQHLVKSGIGTYLARYRRCSSFTYKCVGVGGISRS